MAKKKKSNQGLKIPSGVMSIIAPVLYGYVRDGISDRLAQTSLVQSIPVTQFTDEGVMLGLNFGLRKLGLGKIPMVSSVLRAQKQIELARVGATLSDLRQSKSTAQLGQLRSF